jgi:glutathione S-transferase
MTFLCSHRHTVLRKLGKEGADKFLASTPEFSVTSDWKSFKDAIVRQGFEAPGAYEKVKLYDSYLHKMEKALTGNNWLVGNKFSIADIALTPYVNRLSMMSMRGMWESRRLPNVERWFKDIEAREHFKPCFIDWVPEDLTNDLRENGKMSWPEVAEILEIEI